MVKVIGQIYVITHRESGLQYVGQTRSHYKSGTMYVETGYRYRWKQHVYEAYHVQAHSHTRLNTAIRQYGQNAFNVGVLHECDVSELDTYEMHYIDKLGTYTNGYNMTPGGNSGQLDQQTRKRISQTLIKYNDSRRKEIIMHDTTSISAVKISRITYRGIDVATVTIRHGIKPKSKIDFGGCNTPFTESLSRAVDYAKSLVPVNKIIIQKRIMNLVDLPGTQPDDAVIQNSTSSMRSPIDRYNSTDWGNIKSITITRSRNGRSILAAVTVKHGSAVKRTCFGGKYISEEDAHNTALTFVKLFDHPFVDKFNE